MKKLNSLEVQSTNKVKTLEEQKNQLQIEKNEIQSKFSMLEIEFSELKSKIDKWEM